MPKKQTILTFIFATLFFVLCIFAPVSGAQNDEVINWQDKYKQFAIEEKIFFTIHDIDKDGVPELVELLNELCVYTLRDGVVTCVFTETIEDKSPGLYEGEPRPIARVYAPRDNNEAALYYTITVYHPFNPMNDFDEYSAIHTYVYRLNVKDGIYTSEIVAESRTEHLMSGQPPYVNTTYSIKEKPVSKYEFVASSPLGAMLPSIQPYENFNYGWSPLLGATPEYRIKTLFERYDFDPAFSSPGALYPNISNPNVSITGYYYNVRYNVTSIENSIMTRYPNNLLDLTILSEEDTTSFSLLMVNGNFISGEDVFSDKDTLYVPLRTVCQQLGYQIDWIDGAAVISDRGKILDRLYTKADWDGVFVNDRIYVPIHYFEKLHCDVQLVPEFFDISLPADMVSQTIAIERIYDETFTVSLAAAKNSLWEALEESNRYTRDIDSIDGWFLDAMGEDYRNRILEIKKGFSYEDITYKGNIGRYYIFSLKDEKYICLMNKYTREIHRFQGNGIAPGLDPAMYEYSYQYF